MLQMQSASEHVTSTFSTYQIITYIESRLLTVANEMVKADHASDDNHVINWPASTVLDKESDSNARWIKGVVYIRKERRRLMNQDKGSHTLSHTHD